MTIDCRCEFNRKPNIYCGYHTYANGTTMHPLQEICLNLEKDCVCMKSAYEILPHTACLAHYNEYYDRKPMKKIIEGIKDENGAFIPIPKPQPDPEVSLDDITKRILSSLDKAVRQLSTNISGGDVSRDVIGALKDAFAMVKDLRKEEKDLIDSMSDEELEKLNGIDKR